MGGIAHCLEFGLLEIILRGGSDPYSAVAKDQKFHIIMMKIMRIANAPGAARLTVL